MLVSTPEQYKIDFREARSESAHPAQRDQLSESVLNGKGYIAKVVWNRGDHKPISRRAQCAGRVVRFKVVDAGDQN